MIGSQSFFYVIFISLSAQFKMKTSRFGKAKLESAKTAHLFISKNCPFGPLSF